MKWLQLGITAAAFASMAVIPMGQRGWASSFAGHWSIYSALACVNTPQNARACATAEGSRYAVMGKKGTTFGDVYSVAITSDSKGHFSFRASDVITQRVPRSKTPCSLKALTAGTFNGSCLSAFQGTGHIAKGATGLPDFWLDRYTLILYGARTEQYTIKKSSDSKDPAVARHWDTSQYLALFHVPPASGVTYGLTVTHR